jgi:predicted enzyme related to lactoylglutathione lyase
VDDTIATVTASGGTIALEKMPVPGIGWLAYAKDTEGNIFGVLQPDPTAKISG